jgi:hypothetical protein
MKVRALKYYYYDKVGYDAGAIIEMDDRMSAQIDLLCALGVLEKVEGELPPPPPPKPALKPLAEPAPEVETRDLAAEDEGEPEYEGVGIERRRVYRRRDLRPQK